MIVNVYCPCGARAFRKDGRRTILPRVLGVRLYHCAAAHQFETAETVIGDVTPIRRMKLLINMYTIKRDEGRKRKNDYRM